MKKTNKFRVMPAFLFTFLFFIPYNVSAKKYYVSPDGNNQHTGSFHYPLKSIQLGVDIAGKSDTIFIQQGYYHEKVVIKNKSGNDEYPFVLRGIGNVVIDAPDNVRMDDPELFTKHYKDIPLSSPKHLYHPYYQGAVIRIDNSENVVVDGIQVQNSPWFGFAAMNCKNLVIKNCKTYNTMSSGIYILETEGAKVFNNEVQRACGATKRIPGSAHGSQEFISIVNTKYFEVSYNTVHESNIYTGVEGGGSGVGGEGIDVKEHSAYGSVHHNHVYNLERLGIYLDSWNATEYGHVRVYNNIVHDCHAGILPGAEDGGIVDDIWIFNNIIYNNFYAGIGMQDWVVDPEKPGVKKNIRIFNNTIYNNEVGIALGKSMNRDIEVFNNICYKNRNKDFDAGKAVNVNLGANLFSTDPVFVDIASGNFRLSKESPAINKGVDLPGISFDFDGHSRKAGASIDFGAFEYLPVE